MGMNNSEKKLLSIVRKYSDWFSKKLYYSIANEHKRKWTVKRGEVYFVDLGENIGSEENKVRPVVVIQSTAISFGSPVFICAILSSSPVTIGGIQVQITGKYLYADQNGNQQKLIGAVDLGQIRTVAKERIVGKKICRLGNEMDEIDDKLMNVFGLKPLLTKRDNLIESLQKRVAFLEAKNQTIDEECQ